MNFTGCYDFPSVVTYNGINLTNGIPQITYNYPAIDVPAQLLAFNLVFFIVNILLSMYGEKVKSFLLGLRASDVERE